MLVNLNTKSECMTSQFNDLIYINTIILLPYDIDSVMKNILMLLRGN